MVLLQPADKLFRTQREIAGCVLLNLRKESQLSLSSNEDCLFTAGLRRQLSKVTPSALVENSKPARRPRSAAKKCYP